MKKSGQKYKSKKIGDFRDRGGGEIHNWIFGGEYLDECTMPRRGDENRLGNVNYPPYI